MAAAETTFEKLALVLESTRGTAITTPTHYVPLDGMITPREEWYSPIESRGTLAEFYREARTRQWSEWTAEGGADPNYLPVLLNMLVKTNASPTTPTNGVLTRLWSFVPTMTSDDIKTATMMWGDPNNQIFQSAYNVATNFELTADASGTDGVTMTIGGFGKSPTKVSAPTYPSQAVGSLLLPGKMQLWMDTSLAIGTTEITGRVISANFVLDNKIARKHLAGGVTGNLEFTRIGRGRRHAESTVAFELADQTQYDLWAAGTSVKLRVRISGDLIESVTPDYYSYCQWDIYGKLRLNDWGTLEDTNRTVEFTVFSKYDSTLGADWALYVQNALATL